MAKYSKTEQTTAADAWWTWHDRDASRASATMAEADQRCAAWVAGLSDDGPDRPAPTPTAYAQALAECGTRVYRNAVEYLDAVAPRKTR